MFALKGFVTSSFFTRNELGQVSPIGEISTHCLTYAKEKGIYASSDFNGYDLYTFISALNTVPTPLTNNQAHHVLEIPSYVYNKIINLQSEVFADELLVELGNEFEGIANNFELGAIVSNGTYWCPEWISWHSLDPLFDTENSIKVWLSDPSFKIQYDEFEIVVIPPFANIDDFFKTGIEVERKIKLITPVTITNMIQEAKGTIPETIIRTEVFNYVDPMNSSHIVPTVWSVLIYGEAGNNIDSISDALTEYVLANSTHPREDWILILPDLFRRTEFIMLPLWEKYSIPNRVLEAGIHTPIVNFKTSNALIKLVAKTYSSAHIDDNICSVVMPYKSMSLVAIGSLENRDGLYKLSDVVSDYISVSSTSIDFNRMSLETQTWALMIDRLIQVAEIMNKFSTMPTGTSKVIRDGILYATQRHDNIHFLVAAKNNFPLP